MGGIGVFWLWGRRATWSHKKYRGDMQQRMPEKISKDNLANRLTIQYPLNNPTLFQSELRVFFQNLFATFVLLISFLTVRNINCLFYTQKALWISNCNCFCLFAICVPWTHAQCTPDSSHRVIVNCKHWRLVNWKMPGAVTMEMNERLRFPMPVSGIY